MTKDVNAKLTAIETQMRRWQTRLTRAVNRMKKLEKMRRRLNAEQFRLIPADKPQKLVSAPQPDVDLKVNTDIPDFLNRSNPLIAEEMTAARKKAEAAARSAMPLTGRAALEAIRPKRKAKA